MSRDDATLLDIARAARLIESFVAGMTKDGFLAVDLDEVWNTASQDIPDVLAKITPLVPLPPAE